MAQKQSFIKKLEKAKHTRKGYGISSMIEGALAYLSAGWAIDSGSLWAYLFAIIFTVGSLKNLYHAVTNTHAK